MAESPKKDDKRTAAAHERPLGEILESLYLSQKEDIYSYTWGHLNPNRLHKPKKSEFKGKNWPSSAEPMPVLLKPSKLPTTRKTRDASQEKNMYGAMFNFSMGTTGTFPAAVIPSPKDGGRVSATTPIPPPSPVTSSYLSDQMLVEELPLHDIMMPAAETPPAAAAARHAHASLLEFTERQKVLGKHRFISSHLAEVTRKDQLLKFLDHKANLLREPEAYEKEVLTGHKAVEHLEERLQQQLMQLDQASRYGGPNFRRLEIYNRIWNELIRDSPIFRQILSEIKDEYVLYMDHLLDQQRAVSSEVLQRQVDSLQASGTATPQQVQAHRQQVHQRQQAAKGVLAHNCSLRREVEGEKDQLASDPMPDDRPKKSRGGLVHQEERLTFDRQIEELQELIKEQVEQLREVKGELRAGSVPSSVCHHLEQCIKDTEVDVQKVVSTNHYLERTIGTLEQELEKLLRKSGVKESEAKLLRETVKQEHLEKIVENVEEN